jgi:Flavin-binding monooxygenase-like
MILIAEEPVISAAVAVALPVAPHVATVRNLAHARQEFHALETWLMSDESCQRPRHEVEREQERRGREIQRLLLEAHVAQRGTGDVGPAVEVGTTESPGEPMLHPHRRLDPYHPQTIFGEITVERTGYCRPGAAAVHPLDDYLQLPRRSFSYELHRRLIQAAVQGPFAEATARVAEATGVVIPKRSAEQLVWEAAQDFEPFYQRRTPPPEAATGPILVAALDGKGVPMVKADPAPRVVQRRKGQKAQQKKMAVVATVYTQGPRVGSPQEVFESRFGLEPPLTPPTGEPSPLRERPEYKRVWASLGFHPDLPGLAFIGQYTLIGPYAPCIELQARWIAMVWSGVRELPPRDRMERGIEAWRETRKMTSTVLLPPLAVALSQEASVAPDLAARPEITRPLLFGPLAPAQFRLDGHGRRADALDLYKQAISSFGGNTSPVSTAEELREVRLLAGALRDRAPELGAALHTLEQLAAQNR